ncbi:MAG TPA: UDP-2,3-diacylglucosamine diphosphatase [Rhodocyclaceae bacterium]|nr:UDP-2,3-diacylglucosamine diphosphatase [Rhodocyclaceae bacterium]
MKVRSLFISDVHLGTRACQAERLLEFLKNYEAENLYLVGDIVDFWSLSRNIYWTSQHNTVLQKILRRARHGENVVLIPGNHDEILREYHGLSFGNILVVKDCIHEAADGRRYLVIHGDEFDQVTRYHRWIAVLGDVGYDLLVNANNWLSIVRRSLRRPGYWSLAGYAKRRVKQAISFVFDFEKALIHAVRERNLDGAICGHIHFAAIKKIDRLVYINCGDWVDSCTAIVEHLDGRMELMHADAAPQLEDPTPTVESFYDAEPAAATPAV